MLVRDRAKPIVVVAREKVREFVDNDVFEALACPPSPAAWLRRKAR
jgi:hypothetical protein